MASGFGSPPGANSAAAKPSFAARAKAFFSRGKPAVAPVLPCGRHLPPPLPPRPCNLDRVAVDVSVKAKEKVHSRVSLSNAYPIACDSNAAAAQGLARLLSADQIQLLGQHAIVVDMLSPFAEPHKAPGQANQLGDHNKLEKVSLKGTVQSTYASQCGEPKHPKLIARSILGGEQTGDFDRAKKSCAEDKAEEAEAEARRAQIAAEKDPRRRKQLEDELKQEEQQRQADEKLDPSLPRGTNTLQPIEMAITSGVFDWEWLRRRLRHPTEIFSGGLEGPEVVVECLSCGYPLGSAQQRKPTLDVFLRLRALNDLAADVQFVRGITWSGSKSKKIEGASLTNSARQTTTKETSGRGVGYQSREIGRTTTLGEEGGEIVVDTDKLEASQTTGFKGQSGASAEADYRSAVTPDDPRLSKAENAAKRAREERIDLARSMRMHSMFKEKPDPLLPAQSKALRDGIDKVNKSLNTPLAGGAFKVAFVVNGNRIDTSNAVKALETIQQWLDDIQSILRIISDLSSAASGALLPFQLEVGLNYELTLLKGSVVARRWSELLPPVQGPAYYFSRERPRWQVRFDLTVVDGSFGVSVGGRLALLHKWIASVGVSIEFTIGGVVRIAFPLIQDGSAEREVNLMTRIPASLASKAEANAGPFYIDMKGDLAGGLIWRWVFVYRAGKLDCLEANLRSEEISACFVISRGNKLKARFYDEYEATSMYQRPKNGRATWIPEGKINRSWAGGGTQSKPAKP